MTPTLQASSEMLPPPPPSQRPPFRNSTNNPNFSEDVISTVQNFMMKKTSSLTPRDVSKKKTTDDTPSLPRQDTADENEDLLASSNMEVFDDLPHFNIIRHLRHGTDYRMLQLEEKLHILEFLLDQLLQTEIFSQIISMRCAITESSPLKFGPLPTCRELQNLTNRDECAVCGLEGELLCCDGCTSSYHRKCVGIGPDVELGDGVWHCVECKIIDPAKMGPLHVGCKVGLEWFTFKDLLNVYGREVLAGKVKEEEKSENATKVSATEFTTGTENSSTSLTVDTKTSVTTIEANTSAQSSPPNDMKIQGSSPCPLPAPESEAATIQEEQTNLPPQSQAQAPSPQPESIPSAPPVWETDKRQFIIIHGYVFTRSPSLLNPSPPTPMDPTTLHAFLKSLGPHITSLWPFCQIPFDTNKLYPSHPPKEYGYNAGTKGYYLEYCCTPASYNPTLYVNLYKGAPWHPLVSGGSAVYTPINDETVRVPPQMMISRDVTKEDMALNQILRTDISFYDPYSVLRSYLLMLEKTLFRASLLEESWGLNKQLVPHNLWREKVQHCTSLKELAKLAVRLVDSAHCRAFFDEWNRHPSNRPSTHNSFSSASSQGGTNKTVRTYVSVDGGDWTPELEKQRRQWELCSSDVDVLHLLMAEGREQLTGWGSGGSGGRKRRKDAKGSGASAMQKSPVVNAVLNGMKEREAMAEQAMAIHASQGDSTSTITTTKMAEADDLPPLQTIPSELSSTTAIATPTKKMPKNMSSPKKKVSAKKKKRRRTDVASTTTPTSSSRRRSGRVQNQSTRTYELDTLLNLTAPNSQEPVPNPLGHMTLRDQIAKIRRDKISTLEALLLNANPNDAREAHWPICGRKLFEPEGSLPLKDIRRLARRGGMSRVPFMTYSPKFEVGQVCVGYFWRKKMLSVRSIEEFCFQIRVLESYLNRSSIATCESLSRRTHSTKSQFPKVIRCSLRDTHTGLMEHFVVTKTKQRGTWLSDEAVEHPCLILELSKRIDYRQKIFSAIVSATLKKETERLDNLQRENEMRLDLEQRWRESCLECDAAKEALEKAQISVSEKIDFANEAREVKDLLLSIAQKEETKLEAERKKIADDRERKRAAKKEAERKKAEETRRKKAVLAEARKKKEKEHEEKLKLVTQRRQKLEEEEQQRKRASRDREKKPGSLEHSVLLEFANAELHHKNETKRLLRESAQSGLSIVPMEKMNKLRLESMEMMKRANDVLKSLESAKAVDDESLTKKLSEAEDAGVKLYVKDLENGGLQSEEKHNKQAKKTPNKNVAKKATPKKKKATKKNVSSNKNNNSNSMTSNLSHSSQALSHHGPSSATAPLASSYTSREPSPFQNNVPAPSNPPIDMSSFASLPPGMQQQLLHQFPMLQNEFEVTKRSMATSATASGSGERSSLLSNYGGGQSQVSSLSYHNDARRSYGGGGGGGGGGQQQSLLIHADYNQRQQQQLDNVSSYHSSGLQDTLDSYLQGGGGGGRQTSHNVGRAASSINVGNSSAGGRSTSTHNTGAGMYDQSSSYSAASAGAGRDFSSEVTSSNPSAYSILTDYSQRGTTTNNASLARGMMYGVGDIAPSPFSQASTGFSNGSLAGLDMSSALSSLQGGYGMGMAMGGGHFGSDNMLPSSSQGTHQYHQMVSGGGSGSGTGVSGGGGAQYQGHLQSSYQVYDSGASGPHQTPSQQQQSQALNTYANSLQHLINGEGDDGTDDYNGW